MAIPVLYKYLPASGAVSLLTNRCFLYRCPLMYEDRNDCRADLLEHVVPQDCRAAFRAEFVKLLCDQNDPPAPFNAAGLSFQNLRKTTTPWTEKEIDIAYGDLIENMFNDFDQQKKKVKSEQELILQQLRVLCLCERNDSQPMWREYADESRGVCIGFKYVPEIDSALGAARRVEYVDKWPAIATPYEWARHLLFLEEIPFGARARSALHVKKMNFSHELEWRIITKPSPGSRADHDGKLLISIDPPEVAEIILGAAMNSRDEQKIRDASQTFCPGVLIHKRTYAANR